MTLRAIAIDDEPFALEVLADDLRKIPGLDLVGTFTNPLRAMDLIRQQAVELLFLDIQMPMLLGTQFLRSLSKPPMVIFTTAYEQYALEGYELDVVDYLLKPIRFERLLKACNKAADTFRNQQSPGTDGSADPFFFIFSEYKQLKIHHHEVLYVEGLKDYVKIFLINQPLPVLTRLNMKAIEARLDPALFCRVHQSYIVSLNRIIAFQKTRLLLGGNPLGGNPPDTIEVPVGGRYADAFLARYRGE